MAKYLLRIQARQIRSEGESIKKIAKKLGVSKSTVSTWVRDVILSQELLKKLKNDSLKGAERGRLKNKLLNQEKRLRILHEAKEIGRATLENITSREFLIAGLSLYWGEGGKMNRRIEFCNSDPKMVKFFIRWLQNCFNVASEDFICTIGINEIHLSREKTLKEFWAIVTGLPLSQFNKTSFKRVNNRKIYANFNEHFGTLTVYVKKSTNTYYKMMGLIEGLHANMPT